MISPFSFMSKNAELYSLCPNSDNIINVVERRTPIWEI